VARIGDRRRPLDLAGGPQLRQQERVQPLPNTRPLPLIQTAITGRAATEAKLERQMPPRDPRMQHEQDPLQRLPVRQALPTRVAETTLDLRQQRLDPLPQLVRHDPRPDSHQRPSSLTTDADGVRRQGSGPFIPVRVLSVAAVPHLALVTTDGDALGAVELDHAGRELDRTRGWDATRGSAASRPESGDPEQFAVIVVEPVSSDCWVGVGRRARSAARCLRWRAAAGFGELRTDGIVAARLRAACCLVSRRGVVSLSPVALEGSAEWT